MKRVGISLVCLSITLVCSARTITVDDDGPADFNNLQAAIDAAVNGDEVIVADGWYSGPGNYDVEFMGKAITVRSENGPTYCTIDCRWMGQGFRFRHQETNASILDGFRIVNGKGFWGSGIHCETKACPTIANCIIEDNTSDYAGAGIYCGRDAVPTITGCVVRNNTAGNYGGGICFEYTTVQLFDCEIMNNTSEYQGGGIYLRECSGLIKDCIVSGNSARYGGGINTLMGTETLWNCVVANNQAEYEGGGMRCQYSTSTITNCTFHGNLASYTGGGILCSYESSPVLTNCIFTGNDPAGIWEGSYTAEPTIRYCFFSNNAEGDYFDYENWRSYTGPGQLNSLPEVSDSVAGDVRFAFADDFHLMGGSGAIDKGTNNPPGGLPENDIDGNSRMLAGGVGRFPIVDIGADEYVKSAPTIAVSPSAIAFTQERGGPEPGSVTLRIRNSGGGVLQWQIINDTDWLQVSQTTGQSRGDINEVIVSVNTDGLGRGVYSSVLRIEDPGSVNRLRQVWVTLRIKGMLHVPEQYATIQEAVDAAMDGETIEVHGGTYYGSVMIDKPLELIGFDRPVINASGRSLGVALRATGCVIDGFRITGAMTGISLESTDNIVRNNIVTANTNGVVVTSISQANRLIGNDISDNNEIGLHIDRSPQNVLRNNRIRGSKANFQLSAAGLPDYEQDIDLSNLIEDKPIYYLVDQSDVVIDDTSGAACVYAIGGRNIVVRDQVLGGNGAGVVLAGTKDSTIEGLELYGHSQAGILLYESRGNTLRNNTATGNAVGIVLRNSGQNVLRGNACADNGVNFICEASDQVDYRQDIDLSNTVDGKPVYYLVGKNGEVVDANSGAGCVYAVNCNRITIRDLELAGQGVGIAFVTTYNSTVEDVFVRDNSNAGILVFGGSNNVIRGSKISNNGNGIQVRDSLYTVLQHSRISNNRCGLWCENSQVELINSTLANNGPDAGIRLLNQSEASVVHCAVQGNTVERWAYPDGGGISCDYSSTAAVTNSIIYGNSPAQIAEVDRVTVRYCDVEGGFDGLGNFDAEPKTTVDGHLRLGSPCIDKADPFASYTPEDMDGELRPYGIAADVGPDEYLDDDRDGLPDWWEHKYFDPNGTAAEPDEDPDGDGHTNLSEYQWYSSDPTVPCMIYYVDADQPDDSNDGLSWDTAKKHIAAAISLATDGDRVIVAPGVYAEDVSFEGRQILLQSVDPRDPEVVRTTVVAGTIMLVRGEMEGCLVDGLTVSNPRGGRGIFCSASAPTISNCMITGNYARYVSEGGAGVYCTNSRPVFINCMVTCNVGYEKGGGFAFVQSTATIANSVLAGNVAIYGDRGAAIYADQSNLMLINCTVADNGGPDAKYYSDASAVRCEDSTIQARNSIFWNGLMQEIWQTGGTLSLAYCDVGDAPTVVQGLWQGIGNIIADPCFVENGYWTENPYYGSQAVWVPGDYRLRTTGWRWTEKPTHGLHWVWDTVTSLCIDAGDPSDPLGQEAVSVPADPNNEWGLNVRINLGAFGGTGQASLAPPGWALRADATNDGRVDFADLQVYSTEWLEGPAQQGADCSRDGSVNLVDLAIMAGQWMEQTSWYEAGRPTMP